jgi:hypothetical protein
MSNHHLGLAMLLGLSSFSGAALAQDPSTAESEEGVEVRAEDQEVRGEGIINGEEATEDDYPMTGAMLLGASIEVFGSVMDYQGFTCSSTLIAPDVVLIAAHCVDLELLNFSMTFGLGTMSDVEVVWSRGADQSAYNPQANPIAWPDDGVMVAEFVTHPDWDYTALGTGLRDNHDIALLFLSEAVLDVQPALLPSTSEAAAISTGLEVAVVGWGQQTHVEGWGSLPPDGTWMLKRQGISHVAEVSDYEIKIGEAESDVRKCHGDSGGPTFGWIGEGTEETMRLIGVTSHAYDETDCAETGGVDTRVDYHLDWIDAEMRARCDDGSRVWCDEPGILPTDYFEAASEDDGDTGLDGEADGDDADDGSVDGDSSGDSKGTGCNQAMGAMSGFGMLLSLFAVARRRD